MGLYCFRKAAVEVIKSHGTNDTAAIHETHYMKKVISAYSRSFICS